MPDGAGLSCGQMPKPGALGESPGDVGEIGQLGPTALELVEVRTSHQPHGVSEQVDRVGVGRHIPNDGAEHGGTPTAIEAEGRYSERPRLLHQRLVLSPNGLPHGVVAHGLLVEVGIEADVAEGAADGGGECQILEVVEVPSTDRRVEAATGPMALGLSHQHTRAQCGSRLRTAGIEGVVVTVEVVQLKAEHAPLQLEPFQFLKPQSPARGLVAPGATRVERELDRFWHVVMVGVDGFAAFGRGAFAARVCGRRPKGRVARRFGGLLCRGPAGRLRPHAAASGPGPHRPRRLMPGSITPCGFGRAQRSSVARV